VLMIPDSKCPGPRPAVGGRTGCARGRAYRFLARRPGPFSCSVLGRRRPTPGRSPAAAPPRRSTLIKAANRPGGSAPTGIAPGTLRGGASTGLHSSRARMKGCAERLRNSSVSSRSTARPAYMTITRLQRLPLAWVVQGGLGRGGPLAIPLSWRFRSPLESCPGSAPRAFAAWMAAIKPPGTGPRRPSERTPDNSPP
jgi:hypothetical protein